jgi:3-isopropylmalate/(R)-2-methylmalate dehydratase large subunit
MAKTLFDKIWEKHVIRQIEGGPSVLYIDKHFIHEVTSPQAFTGLNKRGIKVFRPNQTVATADHNVPTLNQHLPIKEELSRRQVEALKQNCAEHDIELYGLGHPFQGIVHVIGPELELPSRVSPSFAAIAIRLRMVLLVRLHLVLAPVRLKWCWRRSVYCKQSQN